MGQAEREYEDEGEEGTLRLVCIYIYVPFLCLALALALSSRDMKSSFMGDAPWPSRKLVPNYERRKVCLIVRL